MLIEFRFIYAKYPETNQFAFENEIEIESRPLLKEVRNSLIKWGVIIKRPRIQSISIGRRKGTLYYLNRMFSPIFGISFRTRGGYNFVIVNFGVQAAGARTFSRTISEF